VANYHEHNVHDGQEPESAVDGNRDQKRSEARLGQEEDYCPTCNRSGQKLRKCHECHREECKKCNFWCTKCPLQYTVCSSCNKKGIHLINKGAIWRCHTCLGDHDDYNVRDSQQSSSSTDRNVCSKCHQRTRQLKKCNVCPNWECRKCRFWCTDCPYSYNICSVCNETGEYLTRCGQIWRCNWCWRERGALRMA